MTALVENEQVNEWVRSVALDGLVTLAACDMLARDELMNYFRSLFTTLGRTPNEVWDGLAGACADLCPVEVIEELRRAYDEGLIDPGAICWEEIKEAVDRGVSSALKDIKRFRRLIANAGDEMAWMAFSDTDPAEPIDEIEEVDHPDEFDTDADSFYPLGAQELNIPELYRRAEPKVGRNERCPCGSGKKFKKCCGR